MATVSIAAGIDRPAAELGEVLSPSQVTTYLDCSAKFWYRYGMNLPDPAGASMVRGTMVHRIVADWLLQRRDGGGLTPIDELWDGAAAGAQWREGETADETRSQAIGLAALYLKTAGESIEAAAIEKPVAGEIGGVPVRGIIDILDTRGRIIDLKTSSRKPSGVSSDYAFQVATYAAIEPAATGEASIHTLVQKKEPELVTLSIAPNGAGRRMVERLYPHVREGIREGLFYPNRASTRCSRRYCNFADACTAEFGGEVK